MSATKEHHHDQIEAGQRNAGKEIPILFSTPMVQAILDGRKTTTRRIVNTTRSGWDAQKMQFTQVQNHKRETIGCQAYFKEVDHTAQLGTKCPYGQPGDLLWVRENFAIHMDSVQGSYAYSVGENVKYPPHYLDQNGIKRCIDYKASYPHANLKWKPSIHMPKAAARIWLQVEEIKMERLQDISKADAIAEGVERMGDNLYKSYAAENMWTNNAKDSFLTLWSHINGVESTKANPWVWVVKFKTLSTTGKPQICYKTNEVCKYDCKGLCRESM